MASIWVTGDIHGDIKRLSEESFVEQKHMVGGQDNNFVIITGDFGLIWDQLFESKSERFKLNWLEKRPFTTLWVDGNHENYDRLYSSEYPIEDWHGGKVQKIRPHVIHLMRGECYDILNNSFFAFGGASSHDIRDGVLDPVKDEKLIKEYSRCYYKLFRINHISWWEQEIASNDEMLRGKQNLSKRNDNVDYIITHCLPQDATYMLSLAGYQSDPMTLFFNDIAKTTKFKRWFCGHYHVDQRVMGKFDVLYEQIMRIV